MLLIWGLRSYARQLAIVTVVCTGCGNPAAHRVSYEVRRLSLFFVPLFPVSRRRFLTCTFCARTTPITAQVAAQYVSHAQTVPPTAGRAGGQLGQVAARPDQFGPPTAL